MEPDPQADETTPENAGFEGLEHGEAGPGGPEINVEYNQYANYLDSGNTLLGDAGHWDAGQGDGGIHNAGNPAAAAGRDPAWQVPAPPGPLLGVQANLVIETAAAVAPAAAVVPLLTAKARERKKAEKKSRKEKGEESAPEPK